MICFEVAKNGEKVCTAGIEQAYGVLGTTLTWVKRNPIRRNEEPNTQDHSKEELALSVGGLYSESNEHLNWYQGELEQGDTITIKILSQDSCDKPSTITKANPQKDLDRKIAYFHQLKAELGDLVQ